MLQSNRFPILRFECVLLATLAQLFLCLELAYADEIMLDAVPRSSVDGSYASEDVEPFDFILSPVDKIKRVVSFERVVRVEGLVRHTTYEMASSTSRMDAVDFYRQELDGVEAAIEFECEGRDCGRATIWGSDILRQRVLSTVDSKQHYIAARLEQEDGNFLFAVYVVERGNKRVYAHVVQVYVEGELSLEVNVNFASSLARHGLVSIDGVVPDRDGELSESALSELRRLSSELDTFSNDRIYVLCHVNGPKTAEQLIELSTQCAETAAEALSDFKEFDITPVGLGPLSPVQGIPTSRIEVVVPRLLRREP